MSLELEDYINAEERRVEEIKANISTYASIFGWARHRGPGEMNVAYASCPITTGERMYEVFRNHNVTSVEGLKRKDHSLFQREIMGPNLEDGENFAQAVRDLKQYDNVISPATFFAKGWGQGHYMSLWEQVIGRFATAIHFKEGWQYSNGCAQEFLIGLKAGKKMYEGLSDKPLELQEGMKKIRTAIYAIHQMGVDAAVLFDVSRNVQLIEYTKRRDAVV